MDSVAWLEWYFGNRDNLFEGVHLLKMVSLLETNTAKKHNNYSKT